MCKDSTHLNQFLSLLNHCVQNLKHFLNIHNLLKNANASQLGMCKTSLYTETTKLEEIFDETKTIRKQN